MPRVSTHLSPKGYKYCPKCTRDLLESAFRELKSGKIDAYCLQCRRNYTRERREAAKKPKLCPWCGGKL